MKKKTNKYILVKGTVYEFDTLVCIGANLRALVKYIEKKFKYKLSDKELEAFDQLRSAKSVNLENNSQIIILRHRKTQAGIDLAELAHEVVHSAVNIFTTIGQKIDYDNDEPFAYYVGWLTREILLKLKK